MSNYLMFRIFLYYITKYDIVTILRTVYSIFFNMVRAPVKFLFKLVI